MGKAKLLILISAVVVFCFVPMADMSYEVIVQKQITEEYTTIEPYIVQEKVQEPYLVDVPIIGDAYILGDRTNVRTTMKWRTVTVNLTKYRDVTKTRLVTRPVVETQTKRVSILRYLLK